MKVSLPAVNGGVWIILPDVLDQRPSLCAMMSALDNLQTIGRRKPSPAAKDLAMRKLFSLCLAAVFTLALTPLTAHAATDVTGTWTGSVQAPGGGGGGDFQLTFTFKQDGATLTGNVTGGQGDPLPIANGKVDGDK